MIILNNTQNLEISASLPPISSSLNFIVSYVDLTTNSVSNLGSSAGTFHTQSQILLDSPTVGNNRQLKYASILNSDVQGETVKVYFNNNDTRIKIVEVYLPSQTILTYRNDGQWEILNGPTLTEEIIKLRSVTEEPTSPSSDTVLLYAKPNANRVLPKFKGPSGIDSFIQPALWGNGIIFAYPNNSTAYGIIGGPTTNVGTVSHPVPAGSTLTDKIRRWRITSSATANSAAEGRTAASLISCDTGFFWSCRWSIASSTANQQVAIGLWASTSATSTSTVPSNLTNCFLFGWDAADTNVQFMHNDASGVCTKIDLGSSFPTNDTALVFETTIFCPPGSETIYYRILTLNNSSIIETGSVNTNIPTQTTYLTRHEYMNNGGTAASVILDISRVYIESDI